MKKIIFIICLIFLYITYALAWPQWHQNEQKHAKATRKTYKNQSYDTYIVDYPFKKIKMYWKDAEKVNLLSINKLKTMLEKKNEKLLFATNAGMYTTDNSPKGLYIENGKEMVHIDLKHREGTNFYLEPNGVFLLTKSKAVVVVSQEFKSYKDSALYATQSGPMLVYNGKINEHFTKGSLNLNIRSGVGVDVNGKVVFAISNGFVNFYDFAELFKNELGCPNALFLDGAISRMYLPELKRYDLNGEFGAMIAVAE